MDVLMLSAVITVMSKLSRVLSCYLCASKLQFQKAKNISLNCLQFARSLNMFFVCPWPPNGKTPFKHWMMGRLWQLDSLVYFSLSYLCIFKVNLFNTFTEQPCVSYFENTFSRFYLSKCVSDSGNEKENSPFP